MLMLQNQKFVDRAKELEFLERHFKREEAGFIVLYGRRRVGKTELLNRFIKNKKHIYFLARRESEAETFNRLSMALFKMFHDELLLSRPLSSLDSFFEYLYEKSKEERIVLVIDEFPMLIERFRGLTSVLQDHWDNKLKFSKLFLILCGSSIGMMETEVLGYRSPLYGRRTGQWKVEPLNFFELAELFPHYSAAEIVKVYAALDAIPGYLVKFDPDVSVENNIEEKILRKGEFPEPLTPVIPESSGITLIVSESTKVHMDMGIAVSSMQPLATPVMFTTLELNERSNSPVLKSIMLSTSMVTSKISPSSTYSGAFTVTFIVSSVP